MKIYGIEHIGYGACRKYAIKEIIPGRGTKPVDGRRYNTPAAAREAAEKKGIKITREGDFYSII